LEEKNLAALEEMKEKLMEAIERQLWTPRSNSARFDLAAKEQRRKRVR
jgi:cobaltochelatase CobN